MVYVLLRTQENSGTNAYVPPRASRSAPTLSLHNFRRTNFSIASLGRIDDRCHSRHLKAKGKYFSLDWPFTFLFVVLFCWCAVCLLVGGIFCSPFAFFGCCWLLIVDRRRERHNMLTEQKLLLFNHSLLSCTVSSTGLLLLMFTLKSPLLLIVDCWLLIVDFSHRRRSRVYRYWLPRVFVWTYVLLHTCGVCR